jgi:hypothetical protein
MDLNQILVNLAIMSILLIIGAVIRSKISIFQRYVIPASVVGGVIGLILGQHVMGLIPISNLYPQFAIVGIDVVFAGLRLFQWLWTDCDWAICCNSIWHFWGPTTSPSLWFTTCSRFSGRDWDWNRGGSNDGKTGLGSI